MAEISEVHITLGVPDTGTGEVPTLAPVRDAVANLGKAIDSVAGATATGVAALAVRDDALTTQTPVDGDFVPLRTNAEGALWVQDASLSAPGQATMANSASVAIASDQSALEIKPSTSGGLAIHRSIDLDEGALEVVKATAGQLYGMWVSNLSTTTRFVKFYNAASGTVGTGTPVLTIPVPGNSSDDVTGSLNVGGQGIAFSTGICVGASTGVADADTGAPGANEVIVNIFYK